MFFNIFTSTKESTRSYTLTSFGQWMRYRTAQQSKIITCVLVDTSTLNFLFNVDLPLEYLASLISVNNEAGTGAN